MTNTNQQQDGIDVGSIEITVKIGDKTYPTTVADAIAKLAVVVDDLGGEVTTLTAERDRLKEALRSIQHITDGHGCGRYQVLCSACEAKRIAMEALIDADGIAPPAEPS